MCSWGQPIEEDSTNRPIDDAFAALSHPRRRQLLFALLRDDPQTVHPHGQTAPAGETDAPDDLTVALQHVHLPKLTATGLVEWDKETDEIRTGPRFGDVRPLLDVLHRNAEVWAFEGLL